MTPNAILKVLRYGYERFKLLQRWKEILDNASDVICKTLGSAEIYAFGSVVKGKFTAASDIDVLVISKKAVESEDFAVELQLMIEDELDIPPGLIHLHVVKPNSEKYKWFIEALRIKPYLVKRCNDAQKESRNVT